MKLTIRVVLALLMVMMFTPLQAAEIKVQKWVDSLGHVHFGDQPPTSANTEEMVIKTSSPSQVAVDNKAADKDKAPKEDSETCIAARKQLSDYERAPFLYETDAQGKKKILPDEQRNELMEGVRERVKTECKE